MLLQEQAGQADTRTQKEKQVIKDGEAHLCREEMSILKKAGIRQRKRR